MRARGRDRVAVVGEALCADVNHVFPLDKTAPSILASARDWPIVGNHLVEALPVASAMKPELDESGAKGGEAARAMPPSDPGFRSLEGMLGGPMELGSFLRMAIAIASALGRVHQQRLVHKDIKPANVLVNPDSGEVRLTGFGLSSRMPRERPQPRPPESIAGTLAYMAPEQTGRMNRSIDS